MNGAIDVDRERRGTGGGKTKKRNQETEAQKPFKAPPLSDSFDFSPANKEDCYILPTPLESRAASYSEELIRQGGRFSAN